MRVLQEFLGSKFRTRFSWDCPAEHWRLQMEQRKLHENALSPEAVALFFYQGQDWVYGDNFQYGKYENLPRPVASKLTRYLSGVDHITLRLSIFILRICLREMRHGGFSDLFWKQFAMDETHHGANMRYKVLADRFKSSPSLKVCDGYTVSEVCKVCDYMFKNGTWGSAYGGEKWAHIADTLNDFCEGKITPEIFCDRAFNLAHNTSPIFNKGGEFSPQDSSKLLNILNLQAEGKISEYTGPVKPWLAEGTVKVKGLAPILYPWTKEIVK